MTLHARALLVAALLLVSAGASAQTTPTNPARNYLDFPGFLKKQTPVPPPYNGGQYFPFLEGNGIKLAPGASILTPDDNQELTNKTIDFNKNTILHVPGITTFVPPIVCDDVNGQHLNYTVSAGWFCGTSGGTPVVASATIISGADLIVISDPGTVSIN